MAPGDRLALLVVALPLVAMSPQRPANEYAYSVPMTKAEKTAWIRGHLHEHLARPVGEEHLGTIAAERMQKLAQSTEKAERELRAFETERTTWTARKEEVLSLISGQQRTRHKKQAEVDECEMGLQGDKAEHAAAARDFAARSLEATRLERMEGAAQDTGAQGAAQDPLAAQEAVQDGAAQVARILAKDTGYDKLAEKLGIGEDERAFTMPMTLAQAGEWYGSLHKTDPESYRAWLSEDKSDDALGLGTRAAARLEAAKKRNEKAVRERKRVRLEVATLSGEVWGKETTLKELDKEVQALDGRIIDCLYKTLDVAKARRSIAAQRAERAQEKKLKALEAAVKAEEKRTGGRSSLRALIPAKHV